eukprot:127948_1
MARKKSRLGRNKKRRTTTTHVTKPKKQKTLKIKFSATQPTKLKLNNKLKQKLNKVHHTKKQVINIPKPNPVPNLNTQPFAEVTNVTHSLPSLSQPSISSVVESNMDININIAENEFSIDSWQLIQKLLRENKALKEYAEQKTQEFNSKSQQLLRYKKSNAALKMDVEHLIFEPADIQPEAPFENYKPQLTMNISGNVSIITERTLEPEFVRAANEFIKIRLKCE